jgi:predicted TIM-barrel fold metal-dependent hydrolase
LVADPDLLTHEELFPVDRMIFGADFDEEGDTSEWSP